MNLLDQFEVLEIDKNMLTDKKQQTDYKIKYVSEYAKLWSIISAERNDVTEITFIDCMCNAGVYRDGDCCTAIEVFSLFKEAAQLHKNKTYNLYLNDIDSNRISCINKVIQYLNDDVVENLKVYTNNMDVNVYLERLATNDNIFGYGKSVVLYIDPFDFGTVNIPIVSKVLKNNYCEVIFNFFISDYVRNIKKDKNRIRACINNGNVETKEDIINYMRKSLSVGKIQYFFAYQFKTITNPTAAGMLMFGDEYNIVRHFPEYFLDYREELDPTTRWSDRLQSSSGEWSGNVCDFYFRVYNKIIKDVKVPFKMSGGERVDDTPVHKAIREALANCLINADYHGLRGIVIRKEPDKLVLANPGYIRTGKKQMRLGGESDPRNKALMKMFNLINIGERAGSGVPNIFNVWADEGWEEPVIEERFDPDRTVLSLPFKKKVTKKSGEKKVAEKSGEKKVTKKTQEKYDAILNAMQPDKWYKASEFETVVGVKESRIKVLLKDMLEQGLIESMGSTKGKMYKKVNV